MTPVDIVRTPWSRSSGASPQPLTSEEWLVTNGLGGYASGRVLGMPTRRYHGLLVAALPSPLGRMMMFNHLIDSVHTPNGARYSLAVEDIEHLDSFALELGLPVWHYTFNETVLEKRIVMPHRANTTHLMYRLLGGKSPLRLRLRPGLHFRAHEAPAGLPGPEPYASHTTGNRVEITAADQLSLKLQLREHEGAIVFDGGMEHTVEYELERERGYAHHDALWSPGYFRVDLAPGEAVTLSASTEHWDSVLAVEPAEVLATELERRRRLLAQADPRARSGTLAELVLASDQFIITPTTRLPDEVRAHAAGDEVRSVIAGYHWFTDWGRDTMISLEGLALTTGRAQEAGYILRTFGHHVRDGLIPNLFPEGENSGLYHTADATLWYFHALARYLQATRDTSTLEHLLPTLCEIVAAHLRGTRFGIGVDPDDGLLRQGEEGYQLTWMDAKMDDWVVTPRRGKAVEINALWYNALRLLAGWLQELGQTVPSEEIARHADRAQKSFTARFWDADRGWLYDVIDGPAGLDASLRPNQLVAISLDHPVLDQRRWPSVLECVRQHLLTPFGLRTLAPFEEDYKPQYFGDLRARDAAYHQGTVWAWLIGPYVDACLKAGGEHLALARTLHDAFTRHLGEACIGTISEIFDAEAPYTPRGCISQAWSVAEVLRSGVQLAETPTSASATANAARSW